MGRPALGRGAGSDSDSGGPEPVGAFGELEMVGLLWLRNRVYDPATRAFLGPDPVAGRAGLPVATNPYHYGNNDPVDFVDPLGLQPLSIEQYNDIRQRETGVQWGNVALVGGIALSLAPRGRRRAGDDADRRRHRHGARHRRRHRQRRHGLGRSSRAASWAASPGGSASARRCVGEPGVGDGPWGGPMSGSPAASPARPTTPWVCRAATASTYVVLSTAIGTGAGGGATASARPGRPAG